MSERCNAITGRGQCRASENLNRTLVTVFRDERFAKGNKIPAECMIHLCAKHLRLSPLEWMVLSNLKSLRPTPENGVLSVPHTPPEANA